MFYYLEGTVTIIDVNLAVLDIGGVGYACNASMNTLSHLEIGKKARLYTYCNVKEDAFDIYGFYDKAEKRAFEMLISVSGVGPRTAMSILSSATPEALALSIINDNAKALTAAPGIGKKNRPAHRAGAEGQNEQGDGGPAGLRLRPARCRHPRRQGQRRRVRPDCAGLYPQRDHRRPADHRYRRPHGGADHP